MKHMRLLTASAALAILCVVGACTPSQVNTSIADAQNVCGAVPADVAAAKSVVSGGAANTVAKAGNDAAQVCDAVSNIAANESAIDNTVSVLDAIWESIFGTTTPAATAPATNVTPVPTSAAPAADTAG